MYIVKINNIEKPIPKEILKKYTYIHELYEHYEKENPGCKIVVFPI